MFGSKALGLPEVYVPSFEVKVAGSPLPEQVARRITRVLVTEPQDPPSHFSLQLHDPGLELIGAADGLFAEGARIEIGLGYVGDVRPMFRGRITAVTAQFPDSGPPAVDVEGTDDLHQLTRGTAHDRFEEADSDIVRKMVADRAGSGWRSTTRSRAPARGCRCTSRTTPSSRTSRR